MLVNLQARALNLIKKELVRGNFQEIWPHLQLATLKNFIEPSLELLFWYNTFNDRLEAHIEILQRHNQNDVKQLKI